jgi:hypothetical protein
MRILFSALLFLPAAAFAADHHMEGEMKDKKLSGTWESGDWTITFMDGHMVPVHKPTGIAAAIATFEDDGKTIVIEDIEGNEMACGAGEARYSWSMKDDAVMFQAISDECEGRKETVTADPWTRVKMPAEMMEGE